MSVNDLPTLNALLNTICTSLLIVGRIKIKSGDENSHRRLMVMALVTSAMFLISYTIYHYYVGSVPYPFYDWTRPVYLAILIPHIIMSAVMIPFIIRLVWLAFSSKFERHKKLARFVWPVWIFVSISGVLIYLMLYVR